MKVEKDLLLKGLNAIYKKNKINAKAAGTAGGSGCQEVQRLSDSLKMPILFHAAKVTNCAR